VTFVKSDIVNETTSCVLGALRANVWDTESPETQRTPPPPVPSAPALCPAHVDVVLGNVATVDPATTQTPAAQALPAPQAVPTVPPVQLPEAPQWVRLVLGSMQLPPQLTSPLPQVALQVPPEQALPAVQTLPQAPQLALSVVSLAQYGAPPSGVQSVSFDWQLVVHVPPEHTWPVPHTLPQAPQLVLSVLSLAQYGAPPSTVQSVSFDWQLVPHAPPAHT
jgi:hypothetical protein